MRFITTPFENLVCLYISPKLTNRSTLKATSKSVEVQFSRGYVVFFVSRNVVSIGISIVFLSDFLKDLVQPVSLSTYF